MNSVKGFSRTYIYVSVCPSWGWEAFHWMDGSTGWSHFATYLLSAYGHLACLHLFTLCVCCWWCGCAYFLIFQNVPDVGAQCTYPSEGVFIQCPLLLSQTQLDQVTWGPGCSTPVKPLHTRCRMPSPRWDGCIRREVCGSVTFELFPSGSCCKLVSDVSNLEWWCEGCGCIYLFLISGNSENQFLFY